MSTDKINESGKDLDTLFGRNKIDSNKDKTLKDKNDEIRLREFDRIKEYYFDIKKNSEKNDEIKKSINQYSIYLPKEIQLKLKSKASEDGKSVSDVIRNLIINNYLSDQEIKDAYNKGYDKRHSQSIQH